MIKMAPAAPPTTVTATTRTSTTFASVVPSKLVCAPADAVGTVGAAPCGAAEALGTVGTPACGPAGAPGTPGAPVWGPPEAADTAGCALCGAAGAWGSTVWEPADSMNTPDRPTRSPIIAGETLDRSSEATTGSASGINSRDRAQRPQKRADAGSSSPQAGQRLVSVPGTDADARGAPGGFAS